MIYRVHIEETATYFFDVEITDTDIDEYGSLEDAQKYLGIEALIDADNLNEHFVNITERELGSCNEIKE